MKALILSAGFGTRLSPYTDAVPKPLFTLNNTPLLGHIIRQLESAGCDHILINTHHLSEQIHDYIEQLSSTATLQTLFEPEILDTGGAIANAKPWLNRSDFFVVNADIFSTISLEAVFQSHLDSNAIATLVLHDCSEFNKITVGKDGYVLNFDGGKNGLAFTGIQVLSPDVFEYFPTKKKFSSIDVYKSLCKIQRVKAWTAASHVWSDIGTPERYSDISIKYLASTTLNVAPDDIGAIKIQALAGDGSDRKWFRAETQGKSCIISDHGICLESSEQRRQFDSFVYIGRHLFQKDLFVPEILETETLSGLVSLEDLGDTHLQTKVLKAEHPDEILSLYKKAIDRLIAFSQSGIVGFNPDWTCQTRAYDKTLILQKECRYFIDAFVQGYAGLDIDFTRIKPEFEYIADQAVLNGYMGLMHRDCQSRNIMIYNDDLFFIDFQSARSGPLQYDLASLMIDPYVEIEPALQDNLLEYTLRQLGLTTEQKKDFVTNYQYCRLTRNLQILGAFGYLTRVKLKHHFESYIPRALVQLKNTVRTILSPSLQELKKLMEKL